MAAPIDGLACVVFDCAEPATLAQWWQQLVGGEIVYDDDGDATLHLPGWPRLDFIRVPEPKTVKNRMHLDLATTDYDAAIATTEALGAARATDVYDGDVFTVFRDPEGNEFCLLRPGWDQHRSPS
ncbi:MAG TPA: VOC family protein [Mycobacteriales bacterium]|nr:VOC family protein [Mycobacteriales bacterium]